ncbi:hypothetical protein THAOC_19342, partial [Thalassiosira oceanica]
MQTASAQPPPAKNLTAKNILASFGSWNSCQEGPPRCYNSREAEEEIKVVLRITNTEYNEVAFEAGCGSPALRACRRDGIVRGIVASRTRRRTVIATVATGRHGLRGT